MATFQMACNRVAWPCGCTAWDEWEDGAWVHKRDRNYLCRHHGSRCPGTRSRAPRTATPDP